MAKYLDNIGLDVLWKKIKSLIPTIATSSKAGTIKSGGDIEINSEGVVTVKQADDLKTDKYLNKENSTQQSMKTKTIVTNLNADLIDGYHSIEQFKLGNCNPESIGPAFGQNAYCGRNNSVVVGTYAYSPDGTGDYGCYNSILGTNIVQEKKSYKPVGFTIEGQTTVIYGAQISPGETITINFKDILKTFNNTTTNEGLIFILPVELFFDPKKGGIYANETQYIVDIIYSNNVMCSQIRLRSIEIITIDKIKYSILLSEDYNIINPIQFDLIDENTEFKCTSVNDVQGGYSAIVGFGSSAASFGVSIGRKNYAHRGYSSAIGYNNRTYGSSYAIGYQNMIFTSSATSIGTNNFITGWGSILIGRDLAGIGSGIVIGMHNDVISKNSMKHAIFAIGCGSSTNKRTIFHINNSGTEFYLGDGKGDRDTTSLIFYSNPYTDATNYKIVYNNYKKQLETRLDSQVTSIIPINSSDFNANTGDIRTLMRYKDVLNITNPINEALNNKVDKSEINQPLEFDVTYNLGNASTENTEYVKLFSVNDGYAVELLMAIEGPFGTYTLEKCVANCAYYPSVTTDTTKLYYQQKLFNVNHVNILMKLPPKGQFYPDQKIRLKLLKAFRRDNTTVTDIYSAITWGEGIKLTNITAIEGQTLKYFPTISRPTSSSSIINLNQNDINNSKVDIDCTTSTSWFIKSDIADSIDSLFTINSSAFPAAGTAIDFIFDVDFKNGINLALSDSIVATYSEPLYKGDKLTFIVPESNDRWYIKLTPVSIVSNSLSVDIDNSGRTNLEVIPISDEKIVACCVL